MDEIKPEEKLTKLQYAVTYLKEHEGEVIVWCIVIVLAFVIPAVWNQFTKGG